MPDNSSPDESPVQQIDVPNTFLLYTVFCGDVDRTAHALDVDPALIRGLAEEHQWDRKLRPIIELKKSSTAGSVERAVNRALNFVQAHRMRFFLERVLKKMAGMSPTDLDSFLFPTILKGKGEHQQIYQTLTTRALADLASALEKCHAMTYLALNDTATERKERKEDGNDDATAAETHLRLAQAMAQAGGGSRSMKAICLDAQLQVAQEFAKVDLQAPASPELPANE